MSLQTTLANWMRDRRHLAKGTFLEPVARVIFHVVLRTVRFSIRAMRLSKALLKKIYRLTFSRIYGFVVRSKRLILSKAKNVYYSVARLFVHQLFRGVFEDDIASWQPDVVHAHDGMSLPLCAALGQRLGAKTVFDSHELEAHRNPPLSRMQRWNVHRIERNGLTRMDAVTTVGDLIADHLQNKYSIKRPEVLFNAPPLHPRPLPEKWQQPERENVRAEANVPGDAVLLVYTGNLTMNRGVEETLEGISAYLKTAETPANVHLSIVGKARPETQEAVERLAQKLDIEDRVHMHAPVAPTSVVSFIATADIAVIPVLPVALSYQYAMPNKLFESTLAGLPILGARLAEMGPFIEARNLGLCYDPYSASDFASTLDGLLSNLERYVPDKARAEELAKELSWEAQEEKLLSIYSDLGFGEDKARVAMVVPNPCNPDFRVVKQAEALADAGHTVRLYCTRPSASDLVDMEVINGVEYRRLMWVVRAAADNYVRFRARRIKTALVRS